ncbi:MAG: hypothetical protein IJR14_06435 [Synergistaceae bacterium]|nr:hypothetical protein [Synergistaceae bacterium]
MQKTPLNASHQELGGQLTDFGGWEMPLWYEAGAVKEHLFVLEKAGIFDICHMCVVRVSGKDAFDLLQLCLTRDIEKMAKGACGYTMILNEKGHVVDDCIVYHVDGGKQDWVLVVNSNRNVIVADHLKAHKGSMQVEIKDEQGKFGKIDLQGPKAAEILRKAMEEPELLDGMKYFRFIGDYDASKNDGVCLKGGIPALLSRTGYTGELGFEILCPADKTADAWKALVAAGGDDVLPCGLASRDSLRMGAMLPLSQQDIGPWPFANTPWDFALPRDKEGKLTKSFIGSTIYDAPIASWTLAYCGFDPRKVDAHAGAKVLLDGVEIGDVTTCCLEVACSRVDGKIVSTASPDKPAGFKPKGLVAGYVKVDRKIGPGTKVTLKDERRSIEVEIVSDVRPGRTARVVI